MLVAQCAGLSCLEGFKSKSWFGCNCHLPEIDGRLMPPSCLVCLNNGIVAPHLAPGERCGTICGAIRCVDARKRAEANLTRKAKEPKAQGSSALVLYRHGIGVYGLLSRNSFKPRQYSAIFVLITLHRKAALLVTVGPGHGLSLLGKGPYGWLSDGRSFLRRVAR
jgi:hypothetical protein